MSRPRLNTKRWPLSDSITKCRATFYIGSGVIGYGTLDEAAHAIYFTFNNPDGQFMNAYAFDPATKNWTSVMRQKSKGPWSLFAEDKFTPFPSKP